MAAAKTTTASNVWPTGRARSWLSRTLARASGTIAAPYHGSREEATLTKPGVYTKRTTHGPSKANPRAPTIERIAVPSRTIFIRFDFSDLAALWTRRGNMTEARGK